MRSFVMLLMFAAAVAGVWWFHGNYQVEGLDRVRIRPRGPAEPRHDDPAHAATIRIAAFNLQPFGPGKAQQPRVLQVLVDVARRFDVLALQGVRTDDESFLPGLVDLINADGRQFDAYASVRLPRPHGHDQYVFLFDRAKVELDRQKSYLVDDPDGLLHRAPLVAWFRARGVPAEAAFTFKLVNVHLDPRRLAEELAVLPKVVEAVRHDGTSEDDVILLGTFYAGPLDLAAIEGLAELTRAISNTPTNTRGTQILDNILFNGRSTVEFTGRGGAIDLMREHRLSIEEALELFTHLPIWAEFSAREGG